MVNDTFLYCQDKIDVECSAVTVGARCLFHTSTASACGLASFPRKRESTGRALWGLDARRRGHDMLLAQDLRNGHLVALC